MCGFHDRRSAHTVLRKPTDRGSTGELVLSCGYVDGTLCVMQLYAYETEFRLHRKPDANDIRLLRGHQEAVTCLTHIKYKSSATSSYYYSLVSGSCDSTVRLWDITVEFKQTAVCRTVEEEVCALTVMHLEPDGDQTEGPDVDVNVEISCGMADGIVYVWLFDGESVVLKRRFITGDVVSASHKSDKGRDQSSIRSLCLSNVIALDDPNRHYKDDFAKKAASGAVHHMRREGMITRSWFLVTCQHNSLHVSCFLLFCPGAGSLWLS